MADLWVPPGTQRPAPVPEKTDIERNARSPAELEREVLADIYDHEMLAIERVYESVNDKYMGLPASEDNLREMVTETINRLAEIGFRANVSFNYVGDVRMPEFYLVDRIEKSEFDIERQQWEVQRNVLEIDEQAGAMQRDGTIKSPSKSVSFSSKE